MFIVMCNFLFTLLLIYLHFWIVFFTMRGMLFVRNLQKDETGRKGR
ncbi:hypothetical protein XSR1_140016 [Xenorhabdus szentirmaii DSM 16338]|uniref:Uncharacterized protein n=1 Tax=Xenorhabdus szentirmaii DSM 16338 TaxID=1427518 RepID=W1IWE9_9GAMM|nr:hypothetical protein XSR1_140016 [Xenorhabdus szentirmaii DSM 16338]